RRDVLLHDRRGGDLVVGGQRADRQRTPLQLDAGKALDLRHVDDVLGPGEAQLHGRNERVAAGQKLRLLLPSQEPRRLPHRGRAMEFEFVHLLLLDSLNLLSDAHPEGRRPVSKGGARPVLPPSFETPASSAPQDEVSMIHAARGTLAFCKADHTVCGVAGMVRSSVPIASVMALMTAAGAAIAPASPQPLMPSGLPGHLVTVVSILNIGRSCARGMQ